LAAEIKKELGVDSQLVRGGGGIFDVTVDSKRIFSKHDEGRFPSEKEIVDKLRKIAPSGQRSAPSS
jgi:selT/selW/selH-like putative selenoprotein